MAAPKHYTPFVGFRTGLSEQEWLDLSDIERKEVFYELRGGGNPIRKANRKPIEALQTPEGRAEPIKPVPEPYLESCPDVDKEPVLEPTRFDVRVVPEEEFRSMPLFDLQYPQITV